MSIDLIRPTIRQEIVESEHERLLRIRRAWEYLLGQSELPLSLSDEGIDDNVRINVAKALVNKGVSWLFGADRALGFGVEDDEETEEALDEIWPVMQRAVTFHHLGVNGAVTGHTFCRMLEDGRIIVWDPSNVTVEWDEEDIERVLEYRYTWTMAGTDDTQLLPGVRRQRFIRQEGSWLVVDEKGEGSGEEGWTELARSTWSRPWAPIFHAQNLPMPNEFWGEPDLTTDVLDLIDAMQAVAGSTRKMVRHRGHTLPWSSGQRGEDIAEIDVSLGRWLAFPNKDVKVGQLEAASPEGVKWFYEKLWEAFHYVTRTPPIAFGVMEMANVKEDTVELAYSPAVELTEDKRLTYGPMVSEIAARKLELAGKLPKAEEGTEAQSVQPMPNWPSVIPKGDRAEAEGLEADRRMGVVSKQTVAEKRGYDWAVEEPRLAEEGKVAAEAAAAAFNRGDGPPEPPEPPEDE